MNQLLAASSWPLDVIALPPCADLSEDDSKKRHRCDRRWGPIPARIPGAHHHVGSPLAGATSSGWGMTASVGTGGSDQMLTFTRIPTEPAILVHDVRWRESGQALTRALAARVSGSMRGWRKIY